MALAALGSGCMSSVTTLAYNPNKANHGVVYALPRTRLKVTVNYTIRRETTLQNGIPLNTNQTVLVGKPVVLETLQAPDPNNRFVLSGNGLVNDSRLDASFKFSVDDNQLLTAVTTDITDRSPEIFQSLVASGISMAKLAVAAGERRELPGPLKPVEARLIAINGEAATLAGQDDPKKLDKLDALMKEQQAWLAFISKYQDLNGTKTDDHDVPYSEILDLNDFQKQGDHWTREIQASGKKLGDHIDNLAVPRTVVDVFLTDEQHDNATQGYSVASKGENDILYRASTPVRTRVTVLPDNVVVFNDYIPFVQAGPVNKVQARYKAFAKRKTTITFGAATGTLKDYGVDSTSSAQAMAGALDTSLGKVQTAVNDIQKAQAAAAAAKKTPEQEQLDQLDTQKKLLDAQAAVINARQTLDKLQSSQ